MPSKRTKSDKNCGRQMSIFLFSEHKMMYYFKQKRMKILFSIHVKGWVRQRVNSVGAGEATL